VGGEQGFVTFVSFCKSPKRSAGWYDSVFSVSSCKFPFELLKNPLSLRRLENNGSQWMASASATSFEICALCDEKSSENKILRVCNTKDTKSERGGCPRIGANEREFECPRNPRNGMEENFRRGKPDSEGWNRAVESSSRREEAGAR
jgi:hypothetical protein